MTEQSLAALAGHDEEATQMLDRLLHAYRTHGLTGIRRTVTEADLTGPELNALIVEAVYRLATAQSRPMAARRDWETFDAAEDTDEQAELRKGGNR